MKYFILILSLLCIDNQCFSQDSISVRTEIGTFKNAKYDIAYDDIFLSHKKTNWLLKLDFMQLFFPEFAHKPSVKLEFEKKIGNDFSINTGLVFDRNLKDRNYYVTEYKTIGLLIEPRWFFENNKENNNNLNGQYVSLSANLTKNFADKNALKELNYLEEKTVSLNYGIQKRVFNSWYFNYQAGIGFTNRQNPHNVAWKWNSLNDWNLNSKFVLGLAFGGGKKSKIEVCDVFRCFEEEKQVFKVDVRGLFENIKRDSLSTHFSVAFETKLNTSFSVNTSANFSLNQYKGVDSKYSLSEISLGVEPRFYYNLRKRIGKGKSANNLSGNYFSIGSYMNINERIFTSQLNTPFETTFKEPRNYVSFAPKWGIQRRIFKHGFIDANINFFEVAYNKNATVPKNSWEVIWDQTAEFKIGFAF
jgi:hypothetical protein